MAGLGRTAAAPQEEMQENPMPSAKVDAGAIPQEQASPEEQALYDQFVEQAQSILMPESGKISPEIIANLKGDFDQQAAQVFAEAQPPLAPTPQDAVSATAVLLVLMIDAAGQQQGIDYPDDVVQHAGVEIIEMLVAVSEAAGIHEFEDDEIEALTYRAIDLFRIASPRINQDDLKAQFGEIVAANNSGQLNKVLPGLPGGAPMQQGA